MGSFVSGKKMTQDWDTNSALAATDTSQIDDRAKDILAALFENDGSATTSELRRDTGLDSHIIHYRYEKLTDQDLITLATDEDAPSRGLAPKVATLTEKGTHAINEGLAGDIFDEQITDEVTVDREQIEDFRENLDRLSTRVSALAEQTRTQSTDDTDDAATIDDDVITNLQSDITDLSEQLDTLETRVDDIEDTLQNEYFPRLVGLFDAFDAEFDIDAHQYV